MKKTNLYLNDADTKRLQRLAQREGRSQADILHAVIVLYEAQQVPDRSFALTHSWQGDGTSVADIPEGELLQGFGIEEAATSPRFHGLGKGRGGGTSYTPWTADELYARRITSTTSDL